MSIEYKVNVTHVLDDIIVYVYKAGGILGSVYQIKVEPPNLLESLLGITFQKKIDRAIRKAEREAKRLNREQKEREETLKYALMRANMGGLNNDEKEWG